MAALRPIGLVIASQLVHLASSEPQIAFPLNSQLPPVSRPDELFSFIFSDFTFQSDSSNLTYSLGEHPSWLSLDSDERRLYGIPEDDDVPSGEVVGQTVEIIATDDTGSTTMNSTLVVARRKAPSVKMPLSQQIDNFGKYSAPSSLLAYPSSPFSFSFDPKTFESGSDEVNYYATSGDGIPLPAWISFDEETLTFSGTTPPFESLVSPPQNFTFQLVASDIVGFSAEAMPFSIVVGRHRLTTDKPILELNATRGSKFTYNKLVEGVRLDDDKVNSSDLDVKVDGMPKWLSFNTKSWKLEGTPRKGDSSTNFTISLIDSFTDRLDILVMVNVATGLFKSTFDDIEAEPGEEISLDLQTHLRDPDSVEVDIFMSPKQDWLKVDKLKISGRVPRSAKDKFTIRINARSKSSDESETEELEVSFIALDGTVTSSETVSGATGTVTQTNSNADEDDEEGKGPGHLPTGTILLATLVPIFAIALILLAIALFLRRRRRQKETYLNSAYRRNISNPIPESLIINGSGSDPSGRGGTMRKAEKMGADGVLVETTTFFEHKKAGAGGAEPMHAASISSMSSGTVDMNPPLAMAAGGALPPSIGTVSKPSTSAGEGDGGSRRSWVTVEDGRGEKSGALRRYSEATTVPESVERHVHFPGNSTKTFRSGLDVAIPSLDDLSIMPEVTPSMRDTPHMPRTLDALSMASSDVLPSSNVSTPFNNLGTVIKRGISKSFHHPKIDNNNTTTAAATTTETAEATSYFANEYRPSTAPADSEDPSRDSVTELKTPGAVVVRTNSMAKKMSGLGTRSSTFTGSFMTDTSFGSGENWKAVGGKYASGVPAAAVTTGPSYHDLVEEAPFNPSKRNLTTEETGEAETPGGVAGPSEQKPAPAWNRDDSAFSGGSKGSYTVFL